MRWRSGASRSRSGRITTWPLIPNGQAARLLQALEKAQKLAPRATPQEQAYIAALGKRYSKDPKTGRAVLDRQAYADAMRAVSAKYPEDLDAAVFAAESLMQIRPWDLWTVDGGAPLPGTTEIVGLLQGVLNKNPNHTGARITI